MYCRFWWEVLAAVLCVIVFILLIPFILFNMLLPKREI